MLATIGPARSIIGKLAVDIALATSANRHARDHEGTPRPRRPAPRLLRRARFAGRATVLRGRVRGAGAGSGFRESPDDDTLAGSPSVLIVPDRCSSVLSICHKSVSIPGASTVTP